MARRLDKCFRATGAAVLALTLAAGDARAFLETGTLLTNSASATYRAGTQNTSVSYSATAKILVANPKVFLYKEVTPTYVSWANGGLVTYTLCFSNGGANTAFKITITDKLGMDLTWWNTCVSPYYMAWQAVGGAPVISWSVDGSNYTTACPPADRNTTANTIKYVRWVVDRLDIGESGCVQYTVSLR